jgi:hypothetical protein
LTCLANDVVPFAHRILSVLLRGSAGTAGRGAIQHAFGANILVDIKPMKTLTIAENREMLSLLRGSLR